MLSTGSRGPAVVFLIPLPTKIVLLYSVMIWNRLSGKISMPAPICIWSARFKTAGPITPSTVALLKVESRVKRYAQFAVAVML